MCDRWLDLSAGLAIGAGDERRLNKMIFDCLFGVSEAVTGGGVQCLFPFLFLVNYI